MPVNRPEWLAELKKDPVKYGIWIQKKRAKDRAYYRARDAAGRPLRRDKKKVRAYNVWYQFRIRMEDVSRLFENQEGLCGICSRTMLPLGGKYDMRKMVIDHDHETNRIRGLLCHACNVGNFFHEPGAARLCRNAAAYLETPCPHLPA